jgi:hypothetical protein
MTAQEETKNKPDQITVYVAEGEASCFFNQQTSVQGAKMDDGIHTMRPA